MDSSPNITRSNVYRMYSALVMPCSFDMKSTSSCSSSVIGTSMRTSILPLGLERPDLERFVSIQSDSSCVFRINAQSASGRRSSHRTAPFDSRSMLMHKIPPICCLADTALRRYPTEVSHRSAKLICSSFGNEFRNLRSSFISLRYRLVSVVSTLFGSGVRDFGIGYS